MSKNTEQGEGGARRQKITSHNPREQGEGGASRKGPSIPQKGGKIPGNVPKSRKGGDHLTPHPSLTDKTSERGGGGVTGHDRTNPNLGKSNSEKHKASRII